MWIWEGESGRADVGKHQVLGLWEELFQVLPFSHPQVQLVEKSEENLVKNV